MVAGAREVDDGLVALARENLLTPWRVSILEQDAALLAGAGPGDGRGDRRQVKVVGT